MREKLARLLDGLTGKVRLSRDDPRLDSLLGCGSRVLGLSLSDPKMLDFCDNMVLNNAKTGNFGTLLALTSAAVDEAISNADAFSNSAVDYNNRVSGGSGRIGRSASGTAAAAADAGLKTFTPALDAAEGLFPRALAALRLTRLFAARMVATLDAAQLRAQVYARGKNTLGDTELVGGNGRTGAAGPGGSHGGSHGGTSGRAGHMTTALTEGQEEAQDGVLSHGNGGGGDSGRGEGGGVGRAGGSKGDDVEDIVVALLTSLVSLCIAEEGGSASGAYSVALGFGDVQLEGVSLLLVLLGTQAYGPAPSEQGNGGHAPDNVFLDVLLREASSKRSGRGGGRTGWAVALPRAALGWFLRRPAVPPGSAASVLAKALGAAPAIGRRTSTQRHNVTGEHGRRGSGGSSSNGYEPVPTTTALTHPAPGQGGGGGWDGYGIQSQAQRFLAAPGALVLLVARAFLYVITLRVLRGAPIGTGGDGGGGCIAGGVSARRWGDGGGDVEIDRDEVSEAPGGAPAEPGEWEGNVPAGGVWGEVAGRRVSPLADRGLLLLLVLLHNRRSATSATTNAFRVAVALCVDADLENERRRSSGADASSSSILMSVASDVDGNARRKRTNGGGGSGSSRSHGVSGGPASPLAVSPMCVSFRGLFEAFGAALEAPLLSRSASFGGGGGGKSGVGKTAAGADAAGAGREAVGLLLYSLLQANPGFLRAAVVRSDADVLLLPLLRILHNCGSAAGGSGGKSTAKLKLAKASEGLQGVGQQQQRQQSPAALYVPAIVVLLFSQDSGFNRQAFRQVVQADVPWYSARNMKGASLGSLIVLCVLRCLGHNLSRLKDGYLLENCLAVLVNVAPQVEHLPPYAAQRLISVLVASSRKWIEGATAAAARQQEQEQHLLSAAGLSVSEGLVLPTGGGGSEVAEAAGGGGGATGVSEQVVDREGGAGAGAGGRGGLSDMQELCGEVARVLFLVVWTCTRPRRLGVNVEVLYAMLHDQTALEEIFNHPAMASAEWAADLPELLAHFQELAGKAEEAGGGQGLTVEAAMEMIEKGVRHYTTEAMGMGRDGGSNVAEEGRGGGEDVQEAMLVTLSYEEGENSEAFFLPYLWELVLARTPDLNWNSRRIKIFAPILHHHHQQEQQQQQQQQQQQSSPATPNPTAAAGSSSMVVSKLEGGALVGDGRKGHKSTRSGSTSSRWWRVRNESFGAGEEEEEESTVGDLSV